MTAKGKQDRHLSVALLATLLIIVIAVGGYILYRHINSKAISAVNIPKATSTIPSTTNHAHSSTSTSPTSSQTSVPPPSIQSPKAGGLGDTSTDTLMTPTGNFVSDHNPSSANFQEQSVCNTSPGATCYIEFIQGSTVKQLSSQVTDINGSAFWTWDISKAGLTTGSWSIMAVATLNGQTKTATDSLPLEISQ